MPAKLLTSGIPGLDTILKGGIRQGSSVVIIGGAGAGKSIFTVQFLIEGAKRKEPGLLIICNSYKEIILEYADSLAMDLRKYVNSGMITILEQPMVMKKISSISEHLQIIKKKNIKRVALDSLTMFAYVQAIAEREYRSAVIKLLERMRGITLLATVERGDGLEDISSGEEGFLFDGVINLMRVRQEHFFERVLFVSKMRGQEHLQNLYPFLIEKGGIHVYPDQIPFSMFQESQKPKNPSWK